MSKHASDGLEADDEGWFPAVCTCGWSADGVFPSAEDAADALMEHAYEKGQQEARA